jgi:nucleoside-diphosphate-sugar epimerase
VKRVVVTGAAGHLGTCLVPRLAADGFEVTGVDVVEPPAPAAGSRFVRVDLADAGATTDVLDGADFIVHAASIYPRSNYTDEQYISANVQGTWNVYKAAAELGIRRIVLTSSVNAAGNVDIPWQAWPVSEEAQFTFGHLYCVTKHTQEAIARHFADRRGIQTIALRPSTFAPADRAWLGIGLLSGRFTVVEDMAAAHLAAARVIAGRQAPGAPLALWQAFNTTYQPPYTRADAEQLAPAVTPFALAKKYWPDRIKALVERGYRDEGLPAVYDNSRARRILGWQAEYTFESWFDDVVGR